MKTITWEETYCLASQLLDRKIDLIRTGKIRSIFGVPRGGIPVAVMILDTLKQRDSLYAKTLKHVLDPEQVTEQTLIVDDIVDSGKTMSRYECNLKDALLQSRTAKDKKVLGSEFAEGVSVADGWVTFPWETHEGTGAEDAVVRLIQLIGEDPGRDGLVDTPKRVLRALGEMTKGYKENPEEILGTVFDVPHDEMIVVKGIDFYSTCEHHMLPFSGTAAVGYVPGDKIVGLSKIARLVDCFSRRLQVQERLTQQIADSIMEVLKPKGVGVIINAKHHCMRCRGVKKDNASMTTSSLRGVFKEGLPRAEFLKLAS